MKIVQTPLRFYPYQGGAERLSFYLAKELVKRGHKVKVICANEPPLGDSTIENIEIRRLHYIGKISDTNITLSLPNELLKENFDIIHTHLPHPWSANISAISSFIKNKPLFLTYHNDISGKEIYKFLAKIYNTTMLHFLLKKSHKIFITHKGYLENSPYLKNFIHKVIVAPPGVDLNKFRPLNLLKEENNIIFFLGILDKFHCYKGLPYLLLAIKKIIHRVPLKLYVGGQGNLLNYYKEFVKENSLEKAVVFLGSLSDEQLVKHYNLCDIFVLPSLSSTQEGFGLVALEAMACKKPVIVTEIVGVADDIMRKKAGIVVEPKNADELSQALELLLLNENERKCMAENAYRLVREKYTCSRHTDIIEGEYLKVK